MKVKFFFAWYDFWVGFYYSRKDRRLYICPVPCCVLMISWHRHKEPDVEGYYKGKGVM